MITVSDIIWVNIVLAICFSSFVFESLEKRIDSDTFWKESTLSIQKTTWIIRANNRQIDKNNRILDEINNDLLQLLTALRYD